MSEIISSFSNFITFENVGWFIAIACVLYVCDFLKKNLKSEVEKLVKAINNLTVKQTEVVDSIKTTRNNMYNEFERLFDTFDEDMKKERMIHAISVYAGLVNEGIILWFEDRLKQNHIKEHKEIVKEKYSEKFKIMINNWKSELNMYLYNGIRLDRINNDNTLQIFYADIFEDLWETQWALSSNEETIFMERGEYSRKCLMDYLNARRNQIESAVEKWCSDPSVCFKDSLIFLKKPITEYLWVSDEFMESVGIDPSSPFYDDNLTKK